MNTLEQKIAFLEKISAWLLGEDTGLSSKFMASVALDIPKEEVSYPRDRWDFGRCIRFFSMFSDDEQREILFKLQQVPQWFEIVKNWTELDRRYHSLDSVGFHALLSLCLVKVCPPVLHMAT